MKHSRFNGKIVLITGATRGIGKIIAEKLASLGAEVVIVGRDKQKTDQVLTEIKKSCGHNRVHALIGDLSSQSDVREVANAFQKKFDRLDILINNAGIIAKKERVMTVDNVESSFAINHLTPFLLTHLLLDSLKKTKSSRVFNLASEGHGYGKINFDDLNGDKKWSPFFGAYNQSKLALVLCSYELAKRLKSSGVSVICADPGATQTAMTARGGGAPFFVTMLLRRFFSTAEIAVDKLIAILNLPESEELNGSYFIKGERKKSAKQSYDTTVGKRLWDISAKMVNLGGS